MLDIRFGFSSLSVVRTSTLSIGNFKSAHQVRQREWVFGFYWKRCVFSMRRREENSLK